MFVPDTLPPAAPGDWLPARAYDGGSFALDLPASAAVDTLREIGPAPATIRITGFPGCRFACEIAVELHGKRVEQGLDAAVAAILGASAPDDPDMKPAITDTLVIGGQRALEVELWCGDCTIGAYYVDGSGPIAELRIENDTRDEAMRPELLRVARTFRWRQRP